MDRGAAAQRRSLPGSFLPTRSCCPSRRRATGTSTTSS
jgi:hypothetical protein